jgi:2-polyprenyl-3-methyl-5-hydroxy-6-metoxy-1,4-benzoquinol methylase
LYENRDASRNDDLFSFVYEYAGDLIELFSPIDGERICDLRCGMGHPTAEIAMAGVIAVGMDSAPDICGQHGRSLGPGVLTWRQ